MDEPTNNDVPMPPVFLMSGDKPTVADTLRIELQSIAALTRNMEAAVVAGNIRAVNAGARDLMQQAEAFKFRVSMMIMGFPNGTSAKVEG